MMEQGWVLNIYKHETEFDNRADNREIITAAVVQPVYLQPSPGNGHLNLKVVVTCINTGSTFVYILMYSRCLASCTLQCSICTAELHIQI